MKPGKRTKQWIAARNRLKADFFARGITTCEKCGTDNALSFAHRLKRRFIATEEELLIVALLCFDCHTRVERLPHAQMFEAINKIIERRD